MEELRSHLAGEWFTGNGKAATLVNPSTEEALAQTSTDGADFGKALAFARNTGGPALAELTFAQRGELLRAMSKAIHAQRDPLIEAGMANGGNTRGDAKFDIDGAIGTLAYYADLGKELGDSRLLVDGDGVQLGRSPRFWGEHVSVSRRGVAVHINAFNFPAWGMAEKAACALLAGMPVLSKPGTSTALLAYRIVQLFVDQKLLPAGAFSFVAGSAGNLVELLDGQDVLAFTGSGDTAATLRAMQGVVSRSVRVNVEADSLNAAVLGPDAAVGSETYNLFIKDVARDATQKTGQKCTAIRRVFAPESVVDQVRDELAARLEAVVVGSPGSEGVTMGPVATAAQLRDVRAGIERLAGEGELVTGKGKLEPVGAPAGKGYFVAPTLVRASASAKAVHAHEVFGPVATLIPFSGKAADASELVRRGGGAW
ncbi:MAG: 3,4-dehydroadipyl-CoA semialdehyde dehydrogenase [Polyangiaceae bacterium]